MKKIPLVLNYRIERKTVRESLDITEGKEERSRDGGREERKVLSGQEGGVERGGAREDERASGEQ